MLLSFCSYCLTIKTESRCYWCWTW